MDFDTKTFHAFIETARLWCELQAAHLEWLLTADHLQKRRMDELLDEMTPYLRQFGSPIWPTGRPNPRFANTMARVARINGFRYIDDVYAEADRIRAEYRRNNGPDGGSHEPVGV